MRESHRNIVQGSVDNSSDQIVVNESSRPEEKPISVGSRLCEARGHLGLSVADVESRLKFASRQIEALEADNYSDMPEMSFVRRFVRSYAKLLKLDPEPLLAALPVASVQTSLHTTSIEVEMPLKGNKVGRRLKIIWLLTVPVIVAVFWVFFVWLNHREPIVVHTATTVESVKLPEAIFSPVSGVKPVPSHDVVVTSSQEQVAPVREVADVASVQSSAVAASGMEADTGRMAKQLAIVNLQFKERSWVKITDYEGKILLSKIKPGGSEQQLEGRPPFSVEIGNARGVRLYYRGKPVELTPYYNGGSARLKLE